MFPRKKKNKDLVKEPKKCERAIKKLHKLVEFLAFFMENSAYFKNVVLKDAIFIENVLYEYGVDKKIDHQRFAVKFKHLFAKENKEMKKELKELNKKVKERGKKIQELTEEIRDLKHGQT